MGYRVNYIVKRAGEWVHTSSQADTLELDLDLVLGPEAALRFLAPWPQWNFADWQIETSCQAGALIDVDTRVVLVFHEQLDYADRAALLGALRRTWSGWSVVWAYNGLGDLLRHAGVDPELGRPYGTRREGALYPFGRSASTRAVWTILTVRDSGAVRGYGLDGDAVHPWWVGADVLSMVHGDTAVTTCPYLPDAGLHLDLRDHSAGLWSANTALHDIADEWPSLWPGWRLEFWRDNYHRQVEAAGGAISLPEPDLGTARHRLVARLRQRWQPFLDPHTFLARAGQSMEQLREADWYSYVALAAEVTPAGLDRAVATITADATPVL